MNFANIYKNQNQKQKIKYLLIGLINSIFAYFSTILIYNYFYQELGVIFIGIISSIINVTFSFLNYKINIFYVSKKWFLELIKYIISNLYLSILSISLLYIFIEWCNFSIYLSQFICISVVIISGYIINTRFIFKKNL
jgi:putative flippase GtrA